MINDLFKATEALLKTQPAWTPQTGNPAQQLAWRMIKEHDIDVMYVGGAAGGGKTEFLNGVASMLGKRTLYLRRDFTRIEQIEKRLIEICGRSSYNQSKHVFKPDKTRFKTADVIRLGHVEHEKDVQKYQGREGDKLLIDEATEFSEYMIKFLTTWNRTTELDAKGKKVHTNLVMSSNPPTNPKGLWLLKMFAPWLDETHELYPQESGAILYKYSLQGQDYWTTSKRRIRKHPKTGEPLKEPIQPMSYTVVRMSWRDNPEYKNDPQYIARLQQLPDELRAAYMDGDFSASLVDQPKQIIRLGPLRAAIERWKANRTEGTATAIGCDVARGGSDKSALSFWHGNRCDRVITKRGSETKTGDDVCQWLISEMDSPGTPVAIDVIGVGSSAFDSAYKALPNVYDFSASHASYSLDPSGHFSFANKNAETWWNLRTALEKENATIEIPDDPDLFRQLTGRLWELTDTGKIKVEPKEKYRERMAESPDLADALIIGHDLSVMLSEGLVKW
jgi:hypothetical protein